MIEYEDGLQRLLHAIKPLSPHSATLTEAAGQVLASSVRSTVDLPPFDNSAMDGYALRSGDALSGRASLRIVGESWAGAPWQGSLGEGQCVRIATGAMLPLGSDAVVMREDATVEGDFVEMAEPVQPWENVRFRGEDVRSGAELAKRGDRLTPQRMALLGTAGISQVETYGIPKVAFVSTGSELRIPGESLGPGQIYESNSLALAELARTAGAEPIRHRPAVDSAEAIRRAFEIAFEESDTVVSIGGASVGDLDLVRPVLKQMGGEIDFWRLAIRPGKPFFFGHCGGKPVLGVPGNPVSAFVTTVLLVLPALRALAGWDYADCPPPVSAGVLAEPLSNRDGRRHFMRVVVDRTGQVRSAGAQASHLLSSLACADGLADVPPDTELAEGSAVKVLGWRV